MMSAQKKMVLLVVSILSVMMIQSVTALINIEATVGSINKSSGALTAFGGSYFINNNTYTFNVTVKNLNSTYNVTKFNLTLPTGFTFVAGSNITNASAGFGQINFTNTTVSSQTTLLWTCDTTATTNCTIINASKQNKFTFDVVVGISAASNGILTFSGGAKGNGTATLTTEYDNLTILINNITSDNTAPTFSSSQTTNKTAANLTFNEGMDASTFATTDFNVTELGFNRSTSAVLPTSGNSTNVQLIIQAIAANATPNTSIVATITDLAGNNISGTLSRTATDGAMPSIILANYSYVTKALEILFDEPLGSTITTSKINMSDNSTTGTAGGNSLNLSTVSSSAVSGNATRIILTDAQRNTISGWQASDLYIIVFEGAVIDIPGNSNIQNSTNLTKYTRDTSSGNFSAAYYNHGNKTLTIVFNETIDASSNTSSNIYLANQTNLTNADLTNLNVDLIAHSSTNDTAVVFTINNDRIHANISSWADGSSSHALYLVMYNSSFNDLAGNGIIPVGRNGSAYLTVTWTKSASAPGVAVVTWNKSTDIIPRVNGAKLLFNITFNESMDTATNLTVTLGGVAIDTQGGDASGWNNGSNSKIFTANINITSSFTEGTNSFAISAGKDVSGINTMSSSSNYSVIVDLTAPKILWAYLITNTSGGFNFSANNLSNSTVVLQFTENMTVQGTTSTDDDIFRLNVSGDKLNTSGVDNGITVFVDSTNRSKIRIQLGDQPRLTTRGIYQGANVGDANPSSIDVVNQSVIEDLAGNKAVPNITSTGQHGVDIADAVVSFTPNASQSFSIPFCINTTLMSKQLSSVSGACSSYTTGSWSSVSGGAFLPLKGYRCTMTNRPFDLLIYTENRSRCVLESSSASLTEGYNLVSIDGATRNHVSNTLAALDSGNGNATAVTYIYLDVDNTLAQIQSGGFGTTNMVPFTSYWIFLEQSDVYPGLGIN